MTIIYMTMSINIPSYLDFVPYYWLPINIFQYSSTTIYYAVHVQSLFNRLLYKLTTRVFLPGLLSCGSSSRIFNIIKYRWRTRFVLWSTIILSPRSLQVLVITLISFFSLGGHQKLNPLWHISQLAIKNSCIIIIPAFTLGFSLQCYYYTFISLSAVMYTTNINNFWYVPDFHWHMFAMFLIRGFQLCHLLVNLTLKIVIPDLLSIKYMRCLLLFCLIPFPIPPQIV